MNFQPLSVAAIVMQLQHNQVNANNGKMESFNNKELQKHAVRMREMKLHLPSFFFLIATYIHTHTHNTQLN